VTYTSSFYTYQRTPIRRHWNGTFSSCIGISIDGSEGNAIMKKEERKKKKEDKEKKEEGEKEKLEYNGN
jgi:hypothetical protein